MRSKVYDLREAYSKAIVSVNIVSCNDYLTSIIFSDNYEFDYKFLCFANVFLSRYITANSVTCIILVVCSWIILCTRLYIRLNCLSRFR